MLFVIIIIIIITLFQEGDIYITVVNHDGPQNNRNNITIEIKGKKKLKKNIYILCKNYIKNLISLVLKLH